VTAGIKQQRPVAVPGQHRGLPEQRRAGGSGAGQHHGGAVARRDVPGRQPHPITGAQGHILVAEPVVSRSCRTERSWRAVDRGDRQRQRKQDKPQDKRGCRDGEQSPPARHRPDQCDGPPDEQEQARGPRDRRRHGGRVRAGFRQVRAGHAEAGRRPRDAEQQGRRPLPARPARRVNQTAAAVTPVTVRTRAACHVGEPSSPASTANPAPPAAMTAVSTAGGRGRGGASPPRDRAITSCFPAITMHP